MSPTAVMIIVAITSWSNVPPQIESVEFQSFAACEDTTSAVEAQIAAVLPPSALVSARCYEEAGDVSGE